MPSKTLEEMRNLDLDEAIPKIIDKYGLGQEIWYTWRYDSIDIPRMATDGTQTPYTVPIIRIFFGTHGALLGPDNYVWYFLGCPVYVSEKDLDQGIMQALENLRMQKAAQVNGLRSAKDLKGLTGHERPRGEK
jgi:hypothetical protein